LGALACDRSVGDENQAFVDEFARSLPLLITI
jgi:hypothetical protein